MCSGLAAHSSIRNGLRFEAKTASRLMLVMMVEVEVKSGIFVQSFRPKSCRILSRFSGVSACRGTGKCLRKAAERRGLPLPSPGKKILGNQGLTDWCGLEDSNFHGLSPTTTSTLRVYQFRHGRTFFRALPRNQGFRARNRARL